MLGIGAIRDSAAQRRETSRVDLSLVLTNAASLVVGAMLTYLGSKVPSIRRRVASGARRFFRVVNRLRRFVFAYRYTRLHTRAEFVSRRKSASLQLLDLTLFRWFDKHPHLFPHVKHALRTNESELVKRRATELLWDHKRADQLQVNDILDTPNGTRAHVMWVAHNDKRIFALLDASESGSTSYEPLREETVRVVRGNWCPIEDCERCTMTTDQIRTIGAFWWKAKDAEQRVFHFEQHVRALRVENASDFEDVFEGLSDHESIARTGRANREFTERSPNNNDLPANTLGELRTLVDSGWTFNVTRIGKHQYFSGVIVSDWDGPADDT